jgi:ABC-type branched-subunit amino acid transport system substrate-binding protein
MPYCIKEIIILDLEKTSILQILSNLAVTKFKAHRAIRLGNGDINIDGGLNDVRAILSGKGGLIKFFCRYVRDIPRVESIVNDFASQNLNCKLVEVD